MIGASPHVEVHSDAAAAARSAAEAIARIVAAADGVVHLLLAGGSTPKAAYQHLATLDVDWSRLHLWFGDERHVPLHSADANFAMVRDSLLRSIAIPAANVHPVPTDLPVEVAAARYGEELGEIARLGDSGVPSVDIALLGLGEDGHLASLFPGAPALDSKAVCIAVANAPKPPPTRVSVTLAVLNAARCRIMLATGAGKAQALAAALSSPDHACPASLLQGDETTIVVDTAAAADLPIER